MDSAASNRFCEAAEQSRNQALEDLIVSPQNDDRLPCLFQHPGEGKAFGHRIQGFPVGYDNEFPGSPVTGGRAAIPARISLSIFSFSTGRSLYLRTLLRLSIVSKVWFSGSCRWFPVEEQAMRKTVIKKKRQILIKTVYMVYNGLFT